jgi:hypothetical protein
MAVYNVILHYTLPEAEAFQKMVDAASEQLVSLFPEKRERQRMETAMSKLADAIRSARSKAMADRERR